MSIRQTSPSAGAGFRRALSRAEDALTTATAKAEDLTLQLAEEHGVATTEKGWGKDSFPRARRAYDIAKELLDQVPEASAHGLVDAWREQSRLAATVQSFRTLCNSMSRLQKAGTAKPLAGFVDEQLAARESMLVDVGAVRTALEAAGSCRATTSFPTAQLDAIEGKLQKDVDRLEKAAPKDIDAIWSTPAQLSTVAGAAKVIADRLGAPELAGELEAAGARAKNEGGFKEAIATFARLAEQATSAPDYAVTGSGWHNLWSRGEYRRQLHSGDVVFQSEERLDSTAVRLRQAAKTAAESRSPTTALSKAAVRGFMQEVGVHPRLADTWKPNLAGVSQTLQAEALVPLRALNETIGDVPAKYGRVRPQMRQVVSDITQAMVEGRFSEWRSTHPASAKQLAPLSPAQKDAWLSDQVGLRANHEGAVLSTREEAGPELLWVTKIGGPSHGFDYGPHCLLPLLANARSRPILVDSSDYPENALARSYLRLLERKDGRPVLYLEPLQPDKPQGNKVTDPHRERALQELILSHAVAKAQQLGVPLSISGGLGHMAKEMGLRVVKDRDPAYVAAGSGGVTEASDTMFEHDWEQMKPQTLHIVGRSLVLPRRQKEGASR